MYATTSIENRNRRHIPNSVRSGYYVGWSWNRRNRGLFTSIVAYNRCKKFSITSVVTYNRRKKVLFFLKK